ncbi:phosphonate C-P lyase system protein PhnH [Burkholderia contaminans]|uniref:Phosphonate C-P lyase system protein PhnH n=1 Tax=Burkholderia contaminans TaxID=488447 RepID=A0A3N8R9E7_9BURK|nr:phosphonate C-P lyase system protein PhnH [Burkholderia contaminans]RQT14963.1 phosphonate C-P lyase system protein PhnH [Burkholderia contaminans]
MSEPIQESHVLARGFGDPVHDAQSCFRILLDALSRPGTQHTFQVELDVEARRRWPAAALASLLTLCDHSTPIWFQKPDASLEDTIGFHANAVATNDVKQASFAYVTDGTDMPAPDSYASGIPTEPENSCTVFIRVDAFAGGRRLNMTGPGIEHSVQIAPVGVDEAFWQLRADSPVQAPLGIDCYLVCGETIVGIPRTTRVELI